MRHSQLLLHDTFQFKKEFGGSLLKKSNPKLARPISTKKAMHIVLRSSYAQGKHSMLGEKRARLISKIVQKQAKCFRVKIYQYANVGNHIHLLVLPARRDYFGSFLRAVAGLIARTVVGAEKGAAKKIKFWDQRPWTRIVSWKRDFDGVKKYVIQNFQEAMGFVDYKPRKVFSTA